MRAALGAAALGFVLAACQTERSVPPPMQTQTHAALPALLPTAVGLDAQPVVYVADDGYVYVYSQTDEFGTPIAVIGGFKLTQGLAVDASENLYVVDDDGNDYSQIFVFSPGSSTPFETLRVPIAGANQIAVDASSNVYVDNSQNGVIYIYSPGATEPTSSLTEKGEGEATGLAVDAAGDLFAASYYGVQEFPAGSTIPVGLSDQASDTGGLAIDAKQNLIVGNIGSISVYAPPYTGQPIKQISSDGYIGEFAFNSDYSKLWDATETFANGRFRAFVTEFKYPSLSKHRDFRNLGYGAGVALSPPAPI